MQQTEQNIMNLYDKIADSMKIYGSLLEYTSEKCIRLKITLANPDLRNCWNNSILVDNSTKSYITVRYEMMDWLDELFNDFKANYDIDELVRNAKLNLVDYTKTVCIGIQDTPESSECKLHKSILDLHMFMKRYIDFVNIIQQQLILKQIGEL